MKSNPRSIIHYPLSIIKAIFFDLGNVLIRFDPMILEKGYGPYIKNKDRKFTDYVIDSDNVNRYMEGELTTSQFYVKTCRFFKMKIAFNEFYRIWDSMFFPYPEMESLVGTIKKKYPRLKLLVVSNTNEAHYEFLKKEYKVLKLMDACIASHELGILKPDSRIYAHAIQISGVKPKEIFYTDDRPDLVEAARVMGIRAFQFNGSEILREQLAKYMIMC